MTNSETFKKAHGIAQDTVRIVGNYSIAFSLALKLVVKINAYAKKLTEMQEMFSVNSALNAGKTCIPQWLAC